MNIDSWTDATVVHTEEILQPQSTAAKHYMTMKSDVLLNFYTALRLTKLAMLGE